jgi:uncharacterized protein YndB with AHSA1/START domain
MPEKRNELVFTRTFAAPCALVWQAFTEPAHIQRWWGPQGFTGDAYQMDLRAGGAFGLTLISPDGACFPCQGRLVEVVKETRLVLEGEASEGHPCGAGIPPRATVTITFEQQGNQTRLTLHTRFATPASQQAAADAGYVTSWEESLARLKNFVQSQQ